MVGKQHNRTKNKGQFAASNCCVCRAVFHVETLLRKKTCDDNHRNIPTRQNGTFFSKYAHCCSVGGRSARVVGVANLLQRVESSSRRYPAVALSGLHHVLLGYRDHVHGPRKGFGRERLSRWAR